MPAEEPYFAPQGGFGLLLGAMVVGVVSAAFLLFLGLLGIVSNIPFLAALAPAPGLTVALFLLSSPLPNDSQACMSLRRRSGQAGRACGSTLPGSRRYWDRFVKRFVSQPPGGACRPVEAVGPVGSFDLLASLRYGHQCCGELCVSLSGQCAGCQK